MSSSSGGVLETCEYVCSLATHVTIDDAAILRATEGLSAQELARITSPKAFDADLHFYDGGPLTVQYLLVVDALNFCFWPESGLEYEHLSKGVKAAVLKDPTCISATRLAVATGEDVQRLIGPDWPGMVPLREERARLLRELGHGLRESYGGEAYRLVEAAGGSAQKLVQLVARHFPGFRDQAIYKGRQIFLYKRAQIFAGDLFGAFGGGGGEGGGEGAGEGAEATRTSPGKTYGSFCDLRSITMFADYRVPVVLRKMQILGYSSTLAAKVEGKQELAPGSEEEVEIRAATVVAVERLRQAITNKHYSHHHLEKGEGTPPPPPLYAIHLDWWLWHLGEANRETDPPHHRVTTVFY